MKQQLWALQVIIKSSLLKYFAKFTGLSSFAGLISFIEKASRQIHIREMTGCTVAIDSYCWLHKGVVGCAEKLLKGEPTDV